MSGLYNLVFGGNHDGPGLVDLINKRQSIDVGRYRDAWVETHGDRPLIRIHTRNGGGNREDYDGAIESMRAHPWFVRDADDDYDSTYADFWFAPDPADLSAETATALVEMAIPAVDMGERWTQVIDAIRNTPPSACAVEPVDGPDDEDFVARSALGRTNPYSTGAT